MSDERLARVRRETIESLSAAIDATRPVALIDFPMHTNVGDHLIYAGERAYLKQMGVTIRYLSDRLRFDESMLRRRMPAGTIAIHGGGNFGDLWPHYQAFKEEVVARFPDYPIVQLPQSIYYRDESRAGKTNEVLASHPDFTLMVRDTPSLERAKRLLPDVRTRFVPDAALGWTPKKHRSGRERCANVVVLARTDQEAVSNLSELVAGAAFLVTDWKMNRLERFACLVAKIPAKLCTGRGALLRRTRFYGLVEPTYGVINRLNVHAGTRMFSPADLVVTDRLHAHVLATLMGIPNVAMDNEYGKVGAVFAEYSGALGPARFARTAAELRRHVEQVCAGSSQCESER